MTIKKFDGKGGVERVGKTDRVKLPNGNTIQTTSLQSSPEQKYVGEWLPGKNHPHLPPLTEGPYAGIVRYLPVPEEQIER